jgi:hypothetical protein
MCTRYVLRSTYYRVLRIFHDSGFMDPVPFRTTYEYASVNRQGAGVPTPSSVPSIWRTLSPAYTYLLTPYFGRVVQNHPTTLDPPTRASPRAQLLSTLTGGHPTGNEPHAASLSCSYFKPRRTKRRFVSVNHPCCPVPPRPCLRTERTNLFKV